MNREKFKELVGEDPIDLFGPDWENEMLALQVLALQEDEEGEFGDESSDDDIQELSADDVASQENPEGEEGFENEEGQDPYGQDQDGEEFYQEGEDQGMEGQEDEGSEADDFLNEMMHSNMEGEEQDPETAELKQKIFTALQSLKTNKHWF